MTSVLYFGDCRFDPQREELWREDTLVPLRPKPLALLRLMLAAPGRPLGKAELLERLWPGVVVGEGALTVCVNELRSALGDRARTPRYIETLHTRGYRFLGVPRSAPSVIAPTSGFVGRERELERLRALANEALAGRKRMVAIEGEAGIGKTTLIAELLRELRERADVAVGRCVEAYGAGEPYMPLLDALAALCRGVQGARVRAALHRYAPTWLVQMPAHVPESEQPMLAARAAGNSQPRMLRELADVIEVLTRERPLVLVLEDLHDSDTSTLTLLRYLMQEREAALLVLASFRSASSLPLRSLVAELLSHRQCELLELSPLTRDEVAGYLATRLEVFDESLLETLHARSGGNPLFMVTLVDHVLQQDGALAQGMPARLRPLIELQLARLSAEERELLLTASVAGQQFTVAGVAACLHSDRTELIERELVRLTRESPLLRIADEQRWPDGTLTQGFAFRHVLQHEVIYGLLAPARRRVLHDRLAQCLLRAFAGEPATIAAELAVHFERGERHALAAGAVADAAASALLRSAQSAALAYTARGFALLERANDVALRRQLELRLRLAEGAALLVLNGFGSSEAERAYRQAHELCAHNDDPALLAPALCGLWHHALTRARYAEAERIAAQLTVLARLYPDPILRMQASNTS
ncbi:MAG: AAA family ATPase, partial [Polyangiales bacterium]